ncbi:hypothetical protein MVEG_00060 [Podila verticillata NRRL 6337]|nr:hypothetical protein MVEG_00060 [Podila verticillata NRRL 6337]
MFAKEKWSLKAVKWWGGWSEGEGTGTIMRYLLDEFNRYEMGFSDMLSPTRQDSRHAVFMGETDTPGMSTVNEQVLVKSLEALRATLAKEIDHRFLIQNREFDHHLDKVATSLRTAIEGLAAIVVRQSQKQHQQLSRTQHQVEIQDQEPAVASFQHPKAVSQRQEPCHLPEQESVIPQHPAQPPPAPPVAVLAQRHAYSGANAVASAALFFGEDTTESIDPLEIFENPINHATAASSVLAHSSKRSGFKPSEKSAESLVEALDDFVVQVSTFPGLSLKDSTEKTLMLKNHTSVKEFESTIEHLIGGDHSGKIAFKLAELLPMDLEYEEATRLKNWILNLVVLDKPKGSDIVKIQLARVPLSIAFDKEPKTYSGSNPTPTPKVYIPEQRASIVLANFEINTQFLIMNAKQMVNIMEIVDVERTIALLTSPPRNGPEPEDLLSLWGSQQKVFSF